MEKHWSKPGKHVGKNVETGKTVQEIGICHKSMPFVPKKIAAPQQQKTCTVEKLITINK